jgi:hypothetical protein
MKTPFPISTRVTRRDSTIFVPLPKSAQKAIEHGCQCQFCRSNPHLTPMWDTLAIDARDSGSNWTSIVHYPECLR